MLTYVQAASILLGTLNKRKSRFLSAVVDRDDENEEEDEYENEDHTSKTLQSRHAINRVPSIDLANGVRE